MQIITLISEHRLDRVVGGHRFSFQSCGKRRGKTGPASQRPVLRVVDTLGPGGPKPRGMRRRIIEGAGEGSAMDEERWLADREVA